MKDKKYPAAYILGAGLNALGIIRSLGRRGIPVYVTTSSMDNIACKSRYATTPVLIPEGEDISAVSKIIFDHAQNFKEKPVLFVTTDYYMRLVLQYHDEVVRRFITQIPPLDAINIITDKSLFAEFTSKHNIPVPRTFIPKNIEEFHAVIENIRYPVILKPAISYEWKSEQFIKRFGGMKVVYANTPEELKDKWNELKNTSKALLVQEVIEGADDKLFHYYSYREAADKETVGIIAQRLRIYPIHGGVGTFLRATANPDLAKISQQFLSKIKFVGPSSVCFKKDNVTGEYKIYEINGRLPMCHSIFQMCNFDLPFIMYKDMLGHDRHVTSLMNMEKKWISLSLDLFAVLSYWKAGELSFGGWLNSLRDTRMCAEFARDDLRPFFHIFKGFAAILWRKYIMNPLNGFSTKLKSVRFFSFY